MEIGPFFKSVRFRVILLYIFFLTFILAVFSVTLYEGFSKTIYDDLDDLLSSRAEGIANSIDTYWETGRHEAPAAAGKSADSFAEIASEWVEEKRKDPDLMSLFAQILDADGARVVSCRAMPAIGIIPKEDLEDILEGEDSFDSVDGQDIYGQRTKLRVYTKPVMRDGKAVYLVQVGGPVNLLSLALNNLKFVLFVLLPLTVLLAAAPGVFLVRLTLKPVDTMINTLRQITAENLKLKVHIPDTKDEIKRLADTFNDMIERLDRSFSSQKRFIRNISGELEKPVNKLKEELEEALEKNCSEREYRALLTRALKETDGFSRTIQNLFLLSQFNNDQATLEIRKTDLKAVLESAAADTRDAADEKGIDLTLSCPDKIILDADRSQLAQMIFNLLDNAVKYTYRNGKITLAARKEGRFSAKISVSDTGIGIEEDELPYIFDRFYQVAKSRLSSRGFGLGLSTVKSIVEAHKGTIRVESHSGKGSTFTVILPLSYSV